ncbi:MAG: MFS transporter [Candidatus Afipia apatlaquensis]|uniref:MFS transporter n=1 Tax=Candidatus Afipia apatlaquensis TaxID=2712852 RepID=A0A7C9RK24_9BRAD|nr:MFS transporter [Candidatus Afipia apatlaquensis]
MMNKSGNIINDTIGCEKKTNYRWIILLIIFVGYFINMADRSNIGIALPFIKKEFHISNFVSGAISSFFFLGYAVSQIPAGFAIKKRGTRGIVSAAIVGFSGFTYLLGTVSSTIHLILYRLGLGLAEGPAPVGMTSTINNWFPGKEKATATGIYIASTQLAPIVVPSIAVWIAINYGWRNIFFWFAIPGLFMAVIWYFIVRTKPEENKHTNEAEVKYIYRGEVIEKENISNDQNKSLGWIDKLIKYRKIDRVDTSKKIFKSWNIWGDTLAYFCMNNVLYGMLTWIPSYLVVAKHYSFIKMGFVAAAPSVGGLVGALLGGMISDRVLLKKRKPTMLITALTTGIMMIVLINLPENITLISLCLFLTGLCLNIG